MKRRFGCRGSLALLSALCFSSVAFAGEKTPRDHWRDFDNFVKNGNATNDQIAHIRHVLEEQDATIELFAKYGLLSHAELQEKMREIAEITIYKIDSLLDDAARNQWHKAGQFGKPRLRIVKRQRIPKLSSHQEM